MQISELMAQPLHWGTEGGRLDWWCRRIKAPSGDTIEVVYLGSENYIVYVNPETDLGGMIYHEKWSELDILALQCVLFELWSRRTRWQKAISSMSSLITRLTARRKTPSGSPTQTTWWCGNFDRTMGGFSTPSHTRCIPPKRGSSSNRSLPSACSITCSVTPKVTND